jgi:homoserine kinase
VRLTALVPATAANLGPGFDCFGLALDLCNEVTADTDATGVTWEGEGTDELPTDGSDLVSRSLAETARRFDAQVPSVGLHGVNRIPVERGLGSSAAAVVAGVALANALGEIGLEPTDVLEVAADLDGHPDNAAAAVFGGFTVVLRERLVARFDPDPTLRPVLLVPTDARVSTEEARRILPAIVARADAIANAGHAALTALALLHEPGLLPSAMRDRLHEDARLDLVPEVRATFDALRGNGVAVCVSGSGPTLLAFDDGHAPIPDPGDGWRVLRVGIRSTGVEILAG